MKPKPSRRTFLFYAAFFFAGVIGCLHTYVRGEQTGVLRLGAKSPVTITLAESPERFQFWLTGAVVAAIFFAALGIAAIWFAFRTDQSRYVSTR